MPFLSEIDIFKTPLVLTYKNKPSFSTMFGTVMSVLALILILLNAVFFSKGLYLKINPSIIIQDEATAFYPNITLNQTNHIFALKIPNFEGVFTDEEFPTLLNFVATWTDSSTGNIIKLNTSTCQNVYKNVSELAIGSSLLNNALCLENFSLPIFGNEDVGATGFISYFLFPCRNRTTSSINCKSAEQMKDILQYTSVQIIYVNKLVYSNDYLNPLTKTTVVYWDFLEFGIFRNLQFFYKTVNIITDIGLIFTDNHQINDFLFDGEINSRQLHTITDPGPPLMQVDINVINKNVLVKRTYDKLQNVFANLGGIITSLMLLGQILTFIFNRKVIEFDMVNTFYDFSFYHEGPREIKPNKLNKNFYQNYTNNLSKIENQKDNVSQVTSIRGLQLSSYGTIRLNCENDPGNINNEAFENNKNKKNKDLVEEFRKMQNFSSSSLKTKLLYTPFEILKLTICINKCQNKQLQNKKKLLNSSFNYIREVVDLASMIKTNQELNFVKKILLNKNQLDLIDHMKKTIFTDELMSPDLDKKVRSLCEYYKGKNTGEMSDIDNKLFDNLDENLVNILQNY